MSTTHKDLITSVKKTITSNDRNSSISMKKMTTILMDPAIEKKARAFAESENITLAELIEKALEEYIEVTRIRIMEIW